MRNLKLTASVLALSLAAIACDAAVEPASETAAAPEAAPSRAGLGAGIFDAESVSWNMELTATVAPPEGFYSEDSIWGPPVFDNDDEDEEGEAADDAAEGEVETAELTEASAEDDGAATDSEAAAQDGEEAEEESTPIAPISFANSDFAFTGDHVIMGNYHGFNIYNVADQDAPELAVSLVCPGGQGDVSVHGDLVFVSVEQNRARLDCGLEIAEGEINEERFRGVRIFDISDVSTPVQVGAVQTCRGSHTHTLLPHPTDENIVYIYVSGTSTPRLDGELEGCFGGEPEENAETALYSIDVIEVPLDAPDQAQVVNRPRIFADRETGEIAGLWRGLPEGEEPAEGVQDTSTTNQCHDITVYPEFNIAAGACSGNGILLDISDPANPQRINEVFDPNMAYWHSANFNNDATKLIYTDEWGGGVSARCRPEDPDNWGANIIFDLDGSELEPRAFFKIPNEQTEFENCVAHNGSLIPVPGRDILVQAWYSGGISVIDFTDSANPFEIAYFDRGPVSDERLFLAGFWSAYWHNGRIWGSEIVRGMDVFRLTPSEHLSAAEIAAAEAVHFDVNNSQTQMFIEWEANAVTAQAYLDQLVRGQAIDAEAQAAVTAAITAWDGGAIAAEQAEAALAALAAVSGGDADQARATALSALIAGAQ